MMGLPDGRKNVKIGLTV